MTISVFGSCLVAGQELSCGTKITSKGQSIMYEMLRTRSTKKAFSADNLPTNQVELAVAAHIIRRSNGTGGISENQLNAAFQGVNDFYVNAGMSFKVIQYNYVDSDFFFDFNFNFEDSLTTANSYNNVINIYFANSVGDGEDGRFCGYAYFPGSGDVIMMDNACAMNGSTLPHEIGHYFSLYHTHGKTNNGTTDELVDGTNCADTGDDICDTPADPNLSGKVQNSNCAYTGTDTDANGAAFVPNTRNIMSYSTKACRDEFSTGQYERIRNGYEQGRPNLSQNNILADFEEESLTLCEGSSFSFTNNSIGASSFLWTFEGGQPASSTEENPTVIYMNEGSFEVSLLIENGLGDQDVKVVGDKIKIESIPDAQTLPRVGSFENAQIQERILSSDESTFELTNTGASDGVQSIFIDNFSQNLQGSKDYLVLGNLNESSNTILELTFDYAYAPYSDDIFDRLEIGYRDPCALDWNILWRKEGNDLATTDATTSFFTPSIEDWKTEQVKFAIPQELDNIEIAIINTNGYGNAVYFDNYIVTSEGDFAFGDFAVQNTSCPDSVSGSIEVEIIGSGQYEYSLDGQNFSNENTFHDLPVGSYTVYVRNQEGVLITEFVEVASAYEYPEKPVITQNAQGLLTFTGSTVQSIQWYVDDFPVAGANGSQFRFDEFGTVTLRVANGTCEVVSDPFVILSLGEDKLGFEMYPNPVSDQLHFKFAVNLLRSFTIRDLLGKEKAVIIDSSKGVVLDTRLLSAGYYLVTIEEAGTTTTLPLVKQ